jgi:hypothetical protein
MPARMAQTRVGGQVWWSNSSRRSGKQRGIRRLGSGGSDPSA